MELIPQFNIEEGHSIYKVNFASGIGNRKHYLQQHIFKDINSGRFFCYIMPGRNGTVWFKTYLDDMAWFLFLMAYQSSWVI